MKLPTKKYSKPYLWIASIANLLGEDKQCRYSVRRTIRHWKTKYLEAKHKYNCGLIGLLSRRHAKGNRTQKLPQETIDLIEEVISENYETIKQKNILDDYLKLLS